MAKMAQIEKIQSLNISWLCNDYPTSKRAVIGSNPIRRTKRLSLNSPEGGLWMDDFEP